MAKRRRLILSPHSDTPEGLPPEAGPRSGAEHGAMIRPGLVMPPIARVAGEASAQAALDEVSATLIKARREGRLVLSLTPDEIDADYLVRDRIAVDADEMAALTASIRDHGQRSPVEVADLGDGRYGLISGWRRLQALRQLAKEGDPRPVLALPRRPEAASEAYIAMIEENEIRQGLSYYERARIAARAVDLGVFDSEKTALQRLFAGASRARRSKIGSFLVLYRQFDGALRFPAAIPERLGLALEKVINADVMASALFRTGLISNPAATATEELERLAAFAAGKPPGGSGAKAAAKSGAKSAAPGRELREGLYLAEGGSSKAPVLTLSGPGLDAAFIARLEAWIRGQG